jgi:hypothetical protein
MGARIFLRRLCRTGFSLALNWDLTGGISHALPTLRHIVDEWDVRHAINRLLNLRKYCFTNKTSPQESYMEEVYCYYCFAKSV